MRACAPGRQFDALRDIAHSLDLSECVDYIKRDFGFTPLSPGAASLVDGGFEAYGGSEDGYQLSLQQMSAATTTALPPDPTTRGG